MTNGMACERRVVKTRAVDEGAVPGFELGSGRVINMMKKMIFLPAACLLSLTAPSLVHAVDGFSVEVGRGSDSTDLLRVNAQWNWDRKWFEGGDWHLGGYWEASLGRWAGKGDGSRTLSEVAITPVFRLMRNGKRGGPYLEGGIGAHLNSAKRINRDREFGSHFNFGTHVGAGVLLGDQGQYDLGYRLQHLSNASTASPNDGINFHQIQLRYNY